jgi:hypothetical protein
MSGRVARALALMARDGLLLGPVKYRRAMGVHPGNDRRRGPLVAIDMAAFETLKRDGLIVPARRRRCWRLPDVEPGPQTRPRRGAGALDRLARIADGKQNWFSAAEIAAGRRLWLSADADADLARLPAGLADAARAFLETDGLEALEAAKNWPKRSGRVALKLALEALAA